MSPVTATPAADPFWIAVIHVGTWVVGAPWVNGRRSARQRDDSSDNAGT